LLTKATPAKEVSLARSFCSSQPEIVVSRILLRSTTYEFADCIPIDKKNSSQLAAKPGEPNVKACRIANRAGKGRHDFNSQLDRGRGGPRRRREA
jgi:hypothetical protein